MWKLYPRAAASMENEQKQLLCIFCVALSQLDLHCCFISCATMLLIIKKQRMEIIVGLCGWKNLARY